MSEIKIKVDVNNPKNSQLIVDKTDITNMVTGFSVFYSANDIPEIELNLAAFDCNVDLDGNLSIYDIDCPESIAKGVYEKLHERFGES